MTLALLCLLAVSAAASPASDSLSAARVELKDIARQAWELERDAPAFSWYWGAHVADTLRAVRRGEPTPYLSYDRRDRCSLIGAPNATPRPSLALKIPASLS